MIDYNFSYGDLELFLLIFVRVASFVYIAPFFSMSNTPSRVRVGLAFFISVLLHQTGPEQKVVYNTLTGYTIIVMKEAVAHRVTPNQFAGISGGVEGSARTIQRGIVIKLTVVNVYLA